MTDHPFQTNHLHMDKQQINFKKQSVMKVESWFLGPFLFFAKFFFLYFFFKTSRVSGPKG